jgi:hypothetical protein
LRRDKDTYDDKQNPDHDFPGYVFVPKSGLYLKETSLNRKDRQSYQKHNQKRVAVAPDWWVRILSSLTLVALMATIGVAALQWKAMNKTLIAANRQAKASEEAAVAARDAALAAKAAADASAKQADAAATANKLTQRMLEARLAIKTVKLGPVPSMTLGGYAEIFVDVENTGKFEATAFGLAVVAYVLPHGVPTPTPPRPVPGTGKIGGGQTHPIRIRRTVPFSQPELDGIKAGTLDLRFVAFGTYSDVFTEDKTFGPFCLQYSPLPNANTMLQC